MADESMDVAAAAVAEAATSGTSEGNADPGQGFVPAVGRDETEPSAEQTDAPVTVEPATPVAEAAAPVAVAAEPAPRKEVPGGRSYEIIYVVRAGNPALVEQTGQRLQALIEGTGGAVDNVRVSETRRVAYPIKKQVEGIYVVVNARYTKETNRELDRFFKLDENVLRHMVLAEDT